MSNRIEYTLPDSIMTDIRMAAGTLAPMEALKIAVMSALGFGLWLRTEPTETWEQANAEGDRIAAIWRAVEKVNPTDYRLNRDQWLQISGWLTEVPNVSDIGRTNLALDWVNYGPSAADPKTARGDDRILGDHQGDR